MSDWSKVTRPIPVPNEWTKPFWDAAKRGVVELHRCQSCGHFQHPPYATCTQCVATDLKFEPVRGVGGVGPVCGTPGGGAPGVGCATDRVGARRQTTRARLTDLRDNLFTDLLG